MRCDGFRENTKSGGVAAVHTEMVYAVGSWLKV